MKKIYRKNVEAGWYTLFFALFILPVMLLLGSISLDLAEMLLLKKRLQHDLDSALMQAIKYFPNKEKVVNSINSQINLKHNYQANIEASFNGDTLNASATKDFTFSLGSAFLGSKSTFSLNVSASAKSVPRDIMLYLDVGKNLAPDVNLGAPMGSNGSASFFRDFYSKKNENELKLITQQCFNPVFSETKKTAIRVFDYFRSFSEVQIGFGFYPGSISEFELAREALFSNEKLANSNSFVNRTNFGHSFVSTNFCGAAAERENNILGYKFPFLNTNPLKPANIINNATNTFNNDYEGFLIPEEYIWMLPAHETQFSDFSKVLNLSFSSLVGSRISSERGNLATKAKKIGIFISNTLPQINNSYFPDSNVKTALKVELAKYRQAVMQFGINLKFYFVIISPSVNQYVITNGSLNNFKNFLSEEIKENGIALDNFKLKLIYSDSNIEASRELLGLLSMDSKQSVLRD